MGRQNLAQAPHQTAALARVHAAPGALGEGRLRRLHGALDIARITARICAQGSPRLGSSLVK